MGPKKRTVAFPVSASAYCNRQFLSIISHTGREHADFGVQTSHFTAFGEALIWGLQQQFGSAFTPEMQQAWVVLYDVAIQEEMMRAAKKTNLRYELTVDVQRSGPAENVVLRQSQKRPFCWVELSARGIIDMRSSASAGTNLRVTASPTRFFSGHHD